MGAIRMPYGTVDLELLGRIAAWCGAAELPGIFETREEQHNENTAEKRDYL